MPKIISSRTPPRIGDLVKIVDHDLPNSKFFSLKEKGFVVEVGKKSKWAIVILTDGVVTLQVYEVKYHPVIVKRRYFYRLLGQVFDMSCDKAQEKVRAIKAHPEWPKEIISLVLESRIKLGMDTEQVRASWGNPDDINSSVNIYGRREQWIYRISSFRADYLYFEDGILTSYQLSGR